MKIEEFAVIGCIGLIGAILLDCIPTDPQYIGTAQVVERFHQSATTSYGTTFDSDGHIQPVSTSTPEKWQLAVNVDGDVLTIDVDSGHWAAFDKGEKAGIIRSKSLLFGRRIYAVTAVRSAEVASQ